ncbi:hypothetical protein L210DRAFT_340782 [Boletus edulis BED1]|uniref:Uncharacterized protein n=1 Tax=Boletus edulis BED1 TaxID=1328754 RepID=A0AAD4C2Q1_BOLED|nr:hypothetical protein L210DRAFT_340782 [Boletus edulis BED1]
MLVAGATVLVVGGVHQALTKRVAILPPRLFKTRTTGCLLAATFLQHAAYFPTVFYLPAFYQVPGASATGAGIMVPASMTFTFVFRIHTHDFCILHHFWIRCFKKISH